MSPAIAGLIGATIGAIAGVAGTLVTQLLQIRSERTQELRSKREQAYTNALQFLLKVRDRRVTDLTLVEQSSEPGLLGWHPADEDQRSKFSDLWNVDEMLLGDITAFREEAFDDIVGARLSLTTATAYCSPTARFDLVRAMNSLEMFATNILEGEVVEIVREVQVQAQGISTGGAKREKREVMMWSRDYDAGLTFSCEKVLSCAQDDLRDSYT